MLVDYARMYCAIPFLQVDPRLGELDKGWVVVLEMISGMIRCQIIVFEVAFNGGVECAVIHVDIL